MFWPGSLFPRAPACCLPRTIDSRSRGEPADEHGFGIEFRSLISRVIRKHDFGHFATAGSAKSARALFRFGYQSGKIGALGGEIQSSQRAPAQGFEQTL